MKKLGYGGPLVDYTMRYINSPKKILANKTNCNLEYLCVVGLVTLVAMMQHTN